MMHLKQMSACCVLALLAVQARSTPIATSQLSCDLSTAIVTVNGGVGVDPIGSTDPASGITDPWISYMFQYGSVYEEQPLTAVPFSEDVTTIPLAGGNSIQYAQSINGKMFNESNATTPDDYSIVVSTVSSYFVYDVTDVTSLTFSLGYNAEMSLIADAIGDHAVGRWVESLKLFSVNVDGTLDSIAGVGNDLFYDTDFDGGNFSTSETHNLNGSLNFSGAFSGKLVLQSTLITDTYAEVRTPTAVPEPSTISLMVIGLAMLMPLVKIRKK